MEHSFKEDFEMGIGCRGAFGGMILSIVHPNLPYQILMKPTKWWNRHKIVLVFIQMIHENQPKHKNRPEKKNEPRRCFCGARCFHAGMAEKWSLVDGPPPARKGVVFERGFCEWNCNPILLGHWLNFKLFGITYLVGKIKFELFFSGSIGWVSNST